MLHHQESNELKNTDEEPDNRDKTGTISLDHKSESHGNKNKRKRADTSRKPIVDAEAIMDRITVS